MALTEEAVRATVERYATRAQQAGLSVNVDDVLAEMGIEKPEPTTRTVNLSLDVEVANGTVVDESYLANLIRYGSTDLYRQITVTDPASN
jgi:hypothetical protein